MLQKKSTLDSRDMISASRLRLIQDQKTLLLEQIKQIEMTLQNLEEEERILKFGLEFKFR